MKNKITEITEKLPKSSTLEDGFYTGYWGGYVITVQHNSKQYELKTEEGVRGFNIKVAIEIKDGIATFDTIKN